MSTTWNSIIIVAILLIYSISSIFADKLQTVIQPDGEVTVNVQFDNLTIVQTSVDGYNLMQVSFHFLCSFP